ncbi:LysR family transcriptional regulator [Branchiibius hedensis]|uniref:ModE molybdate transport repressor domain-containing protein n=1 Tax=Branchiibius hedensis TaxID=672460 RepID=A0A2Y8ZW31_9MICO|nr:LysR family transcriptional regulator [Branchiibius hedensis]PWJ26935.1 LysR family transcriptional regulator [Branchiibius hedensis]SSA35746.1 ModE molybdate transport repressor domain-containing protein [Branchiibius hedensis]
MDLSRVPELAQLQALVSVAREGSMTTAAQRLGVSQQAVSERIRSAERVLGVPVFERTARGVRLTAPGGVVIDWATDILTAAENLDQGVRTLGAADRRSVTVAASNTVSECLLPGWASRLRTLDPQVRLHVRPGNSDQVIHEVSSGAAQLGFVESPRVPRSVRSRVVAHDRLVAVVPPDHPWTRRSSPLPAGELTATPLVLRESGSGTRAFLQDALGPLAEAAAVLPSTAAVRDAVITLGAPAVLSSLAVSRDVESGRLVAVAIEGVDLRRALRAVWHPSSPPRGSAADLLSIAADRLTLS